MKLTVMTWILLSFFLIAECQGNYLPEFKPSTPTYYDFNKKPHNVTTKQNKRQLQTKTYVVYSWEDTQSADPSGGEVTTAAITSSSRRTTTFRYSNTMFVPHSTVFVLEVDSGYLSSSTNWNSDVMTRIAGFSSCNPYCAWAVVFPARSSGTLFTTRPTFDAQYHFRYNFAHGDYRTAKYDGTPTVPPLEENLIDVSLNWYSGINPYHPYLGLACTPGDPIYAIRDGLVIGVRSTYSEPCFVDAEEYAEDSYIPDSCIDRGLWPNAVWIAHCDGTYSFYTGFDGPNLIQVKPGQRVLARETILGPCGLVTSRSEGNSQASVYYGLRKTDLPAGPYEYQDDDDWGSVCSHSHCADFDVEPVLACSCFDPLQDETWRVHDNCVGNFNCRGQLNPVDCNPTTAPVSTYPPSYTPTMNPSGTPTNLPQPQPTGVPVSQPTKAPIPVPTQLPVPLPSTTPTTGVPSLLPSVVPSIAPSTIPTTGVPSLLPSVVPSIAPSIAPTNVTAAAASSSTDDSAILSILLPLIISLLIVLLLLLCCYKKKYGKRESSSAATIKHTNEKPADFESPKDTDTNGKITPKNTDTNGTVTAPRLHSTEPNNLDDCDNSSIGSSGYAVDGTDINNREEECNDSQADLLPYSVIDNRNNAEVVNSRNQQSIGSSEYADNGTEKNNNREEELNYSQADLLPYSVIDNRNNEEVVNSRKQQPDWLSNSLSDGRRFYRAGGPVPVPGGQSPNYKVVSYNDRAL